jgi:hypothetical protein
LGVTLPLTLSETLSAGPVLEQNSPVLTRGNLVPRLPIGIGAAHIYIVDRGLDLSPDLAMETS